MSIKNTLMAVATSVAMVSMTSCGGGWTEESKKTSKEFCTSMMELSYPEEAKGICDCYIDKMVAEYPKADFTPEQSTKIMDDCSADAKKKKEAEDERKLNEMLNSMDAGAEGTSTESATGTTEEAH